MQGTGTLFAFFGFVKCPSEVFDAIAFYHLLSTLHVIAIAWVNWTAPNFLLTKNVQLDIKYSCSVFKRYYGLSIFTKS